MVKARRYFILLEQWLLVNWNTKKIKSNFKWKTLLQHTGNLRNNKKQSIDSSLSFETYPKRFTRAEHVLLWYSQRNATDTVMSEEERVKERVNIYRVVLRRWLAHHVLTRRRCQTRLVYRHEPPKWNSTEALSPKYEKDRMDSRQSPETGILQMHHDHPAIRLLLRSWRLFDC